MSKQGLSSEIKDYLSGSFWPVIISGRHSTDYELIRVERMLSELFLATKGFAD